MVLENRLKKALNGGKTVFGTFIKLSCPAVVEILGHAGFDFVIIDTEHGPLSIETAENLVRAAELTGLAPIIRVSCNNPSAIHRALDIGASGVQVPAVSTKNDAEKAVRAARFAKEGERGVCRFVRAANYSALDRFNYFKNANENTIVVVHVEGINGVRNIDDILCTSGVDVIFLGPYDLSQSLGIIGKTDHPLLVEKFKKVIEKATKRGIAVGTFVESIEQARKWEDIGVRYIAYSVDVGILYEAGRQILCKLKTYRRDVTTLR